jgi:hypothetical protein
MTHAQYRAEITCYKYNVQGGTAVGSTFPGQAPLTKDQAATKVQVRELTLAYYLQSGSRSSHGTLLY